MDLIPVTDLKQWAYCRRIVYYRRVLPTPPRPTYKMKEGQAAQELIEKLETKRKLRHYGFDAAQRLFGVRLQSESLGLVGRIDLLLVAENEIAVVDFKLTSGEPADNHRLQLAGYSLLAEDTMGLPARRAFLYRIPDNRIFAESVTEQLRQAATAAVEDIWRTSEAQLCPEATNVSGRCVECEFANYCGDIW